MGNLNIQYHYLFIILVLALGLVYALALYYRGGKFNDKSRVLHASLFGLRWLAVALIAFFLLEPFFKSIKDEVKKPVLIIAQDASQSIIESQTPDSLTLIYNAVSDLAQNISDKYDVQTMHFGSKVNPGLTDSFTQQSSNFDQLFQYAYEQYLGIPVSSMILISDGIYNIGKNPVYVENVNYAIHPIALGNTIKQADLAIKNIFYNPVAFLNDSLSILFDLAAYEYSASRAQVRFEEIRNGNSQILLKKNINISSNDFFTAESFETKAIETGTRHYRISVLPLPNERVTSNNYRDIFIDVIDSRIRVKIIADHPHPDVTALRQTLDKNKNYDVSVSIIDKLDDLSNTDVAILHNLPSGRYDAQTWLQQLNAKKIPRLFIVGNKTDLNRLNDVQKIVSLSNTNGSTNNALPSINSSFRSFELEESTKSEMVQMPPVNVPYGEYQMDDSSNTLLFQKIGAVNTSYPLLSFRDRDGLKTGLLLGEGIWRWRLNEFGRNGNQEGFDELIFKSLQYLSLKEDKRKWQVKIDKNIWNENERIQFKGILYNDNYKPINNSEANLKIQNQNGEEFEFIFSRKQNHYMLDAGYLPEGTYQYSAFNKTAGETLQFNGQFIVKSLQVEMADLEARHDILNQLASSNGGKLYTPGEIDKLQNDLMKKDIKSIVFSTESYLTLLNLKWLFFLILAVLSLEWFLRRYHGSY